MLQGVYTYCRKIMPEAGLCSLGEGPAKLRNNRGGCARLTDREKVALAVADHERTARAGRILRSLQTDPGGGGRSGRDQAPAKPLRLQEWRGTV